MIARACRRLAVVMLLCLAFAAFGAAQIAPAQPVTETSPTAPAGQSQSGDVSDGFIDLVTLDGPLDPVTIKFVEQRVIEAARDEAKLLVLQLDTPGSLASDASELVTMIAASRVPVVIWIGPGAGRAEAAGMAIFVASHVRVVSPIARVGNSEPRDLKGKANPVGGEELASLASMRVPGTPPDTPLARFAYESSQGMTLLGEDAAAMGVADFAAPTIGDAVVGLDGRVAVLSPDARRDGDGWIPGPLISREIRTARVVEGPDGQPRREPSVQVRFFRPSFTDRVLHSVASPSVAYFLLLVGLTLIAFELYTVGVGMVGLAGAVCVALAASGLTVIGPEWIAIGLFAVAFVMFASDIQEGVRGPASVIAFVALGLGLLLIRVLPPAPLRVPVWLALLYLVLIGGSWRPGMALMVRSRFWAPAIDRTFLQGEDAEVRDPLKPRGSVKIGKAKYAARAPKGEKLVRGEFGKVTSVSGSDLVITAKSVEITSADK